MIKRADDNAPRWLCFTAVAVFLVHASNFLYFFVDDEAIPYVYAQNILRGRGLSYNALDGRLEGYSDFLHVWLSTLILAFVRSAHEPKILVFFVGKVISLACAVAIIWTVWAIVRREGVHRTGAAGGLAFLALAGPLAVWSCSSLETVPFALACTVLAGALMARADRVAAIAAAVVVLERIDGFVYVTALIVAFGVVADTVRRREMLRRIVLPVSILFAGYQIWRGLYFRDLIPAPLEAKVMYKLTGASNLVVKLPDHSYARRFLDVYGWPAVIGFAAVEIGAIRIGGTARAVALAAFVLVCYVSLVGDWMFGFRFFVPLLPLFALIVAMSIGAVATSRPQVATVAAIVCVAWTGVTAERFVRAYAEQESVGSFLRAPSRDLHKFFWPYYGLYETARRIVPRGATVAYNQAGFVPFMLDVNNIDDLGICSRFYAELPSTDLFFTEVGHYAPLTNKQALRASNAYLVYRNAAFVMSRTDLLFKANNSSIPQELFGGYYQLIGTDPDRTNALYKRTDKPAGPFATDPGVFTENLAHVSHLRRASIDNAQVPRRDYIRRFPFLRDDVSTVNFTGGLAMDLQFADADQDVRDVSIESVSTSRPATLRLSLRAADGRVVHDESIDLAGNSPRPVRFDMLPGSRGARLILELAAAPGERTHGSISDLRVQGQTEALRDYIRSHLAFQRTSAAPARYP